VTQWSVGQWACDGDDVALTSLTRSCTTAPDTAAAADGGAPPRGGGVRGLR